MWKSEGVVKKATTTTTKWRTNQKQRAESRKPLRKPPFSSAGRAPTNLPPTLLHSSAVYSPPGFCSEHLPLIAKRLESASAFSAANAAACVAEQVINCKLGRGKSWKYAPGRPTRPQDPPGYLAIYFKKQINNFLIKQKLRTNLNGLSKLDFIFTNLEDLIWILSFVILTIYPKPLLD